MSHDAVFVEDTVCAMYVASDATDLECNVDIVHLGEAHLLMNKGAIVLHGAEPPSKELALCNLT